MVSPALLANDNHSMTLAIWVHIQCNRVIMPGDRRQPFGTVGGKVDLDDDSL